MAFCFHIFALHWGFLGAFLWLLLIECLKKFLLFIETIEILMGKVSWWRKKFGFAIKVLYLKIKIEAKNQLWKEIEILVKKLFQSIKTFTTVRFLVRIRTWTLLWNLFNPKEFGYHLKRLQINLIKFKSAFRVKNYAKFLLKI